MTRRVTIKNSIKAVLAAFALLGIAGTSEAVPVTYVDVDQPQGNAGNIWVGDGYHGIFNIKTPGAETMINYNGYSHSPVGGFQIGTPILSATAYFYLYNRTTSLFETAIVNIGLLNGEAQSLVTGVNVVDLNASPLSLFALKWTGEINYAVHSSFFGAFELKYAVLEVTTVGNPTSPGPVASVPDGGATLVLMGVGLIGLVAVQTRLTRQAA